jgi:membrane protein
MLLPGRDVPWKRFAVELYREIDRDDLVEYAGAVAFSAFLAIFPFLLFAVALGSLVVAPATLDALVERVRNFAPGPVADLLQERMHALVTGTPPALLTVSGVGAVWAATGAVTSLVSALNSAHDVVDRRSFWRVRAIAVAATFAGAGLLIAASGVALAAPLVADAVGGPARTLILWLQWPVAAGIMLFVIACLYHFLPDVDRPFRLVTPGSALAVVGWVLASLGFSIYVGHFARYEVVYGALGSVIVLLLWTWLSALVILVGAEVDAVLEQSVAAAATPAPPGGRPAP